MDITDQVLNVMRTAGEPLNAGKVAELGGLDRKEVDKAMEQLKKQARSSPPSAASGARPRLFCLGHRDCSTKPRHFWWGFLFGRSSLLVRSESPASCGLHDSQADSVD